MGTVGLMIDLIYLFLALILSAVLYPIWINFVYRFHLGENVREDGPQTHLKKLGTPTMGGMVFVFSVSLVSFLFNRSRTQTLFPLFVASVAGLLGIIEDFTKVYKKSGLPGFFEYHFKRFFKKPHVESHKNVPFYLKPFFLFKELSRIVGSGADSGMQTYQKFIFQGLLAGFVAYWVYIKLGWDFLWLPLIGDVHIGIMYPIFVFFMFIALLNSVAFTDGLDGLVGGLSIVIFIAFWSFSRIMGYNSLATFCATFVGALIPFLYFNVYPARVFMGNVGSHVLGAMVAILGIVTHREIAVLIMAIPFLIDGASSPLQSLSVKFTGKRLFRMAPIHHHFELLGWPETKVTLRFWLFGIFFGFLGLFIAIL